MAKAPYPGYSPTFRVVDKTGGYNRTCVVVEFLSNGQLDSAQLAYVQEQLETVLVKMLPSVVEKSQVVTPDRFDLKLREGLRLS